MKKYKLSLSIRKGFTDTKFDEFTLDTTNFNEMFKLNELDTFKGDAYLVASLEELPDPEEV